MRASLTYWKNSQARTIRAKQGSVQLQQLREQARSHSDFISRKAKPPIAERSGVLCLNLDDDLLSHGEAPHYH
ncbi:hypothetical protein NRB16_00005, partial [Pseudomonas sp. LJDD11]|uniref:hypothetical protein n=1 Tax=Pseudomonas sp. LJDD11 TaxID=2931984 RepID=UPI00211C8F6A